jgi:hypothetical protein
MREAKMGFGQEIRSKGFDAVEQEPLFWFYVSFVSKPPDGKIWSTGGGAFMGATVVQAKHHGYVIGIVLDRKLKPENSKVGETIEIPADKLPAEEHRYKLLTREQVETLWPGVRGD